MPVSITKVNKGVEKYFFYLVKHCNFYNPLLSCQFYFILFIEFLIRFDYSHLQLSTQCVLLHNGNLLNSTPPPFAGKRKADWAFYSSLSVVIIQQQTTLSGWLTSSFFSPQKCERHET